MKASRISIAVAVVATLLLPVINLTPAYAAVSLQCDSSMQTCGLNIDKTVAVNGGQSSTAPTATQAVPAKIGDTLTWTITVSAPPETFPFGEVTVNDKLPNGVQFVSATTNTPGDSYDSNTGNWTFDLSSALGDNQTAVLTVVTTADKTGLIENVASLSEYYLIVDEGDGLQYRGPYAYADNDPSNDAAAAFVNISAATATASSVASTTSTPTVKAPHTGFEPSLGNPWTDLLFGLTIGSVVFGAAHKLRRTVRS